MKMKRLITATAILTAATTQIFATEGINLIGIGPVQQGTAGAGVASAKDSTWLILNPAGLTDIEMSVDASFQIFAPVRTINSPASLSAGGSAGEQKDDSIFIIPSISTSFGCCHGENGSLGLGIYGTSGMGVDYGLSRVSQDPLGGSSTAGDMMTELSVAKMTATYAYKFGDSGFSIGAGPIFVISQFKTDMLMFDPSTPPPATGYPYASGDLDTAYGAGAIIGINQHIGRFTVGGSYMSEQFMSKFDDYSDMMPDSFNLPAQLTVGAAYNVLDNVELVCDYRWLGWGELDTLGTQFGWENQNIVKAGITWGVSDALTLRGGVSYGKSPVPDDKVFLNSLFPAIMETHLTCGASYAWEKWSAHLAYVHALMAEQTEDTGIDASGIGFPADFGKGTEISMYQNSLTAGVTYKF